MHHPVQALQGNLEGALPNSDLPRQLKDRRDMLGHYIAVKDYNDGVPPGALGPIELGRGMNFEEKRKLSAHLASLPGEKMQRVVDIVEAGMQVCVLARAHDVRTCGCVRMYRYCACSTARGGRPAQY